MGFIRRGLKGEEFDPSHMQEEMYERMFAKIGRDFVYKEDFVRMMWQIMQIIDPTGLKGLDIDFRSDAQARKRAVEYKSVIESGKNGSVLFQDLIDMEDDWSI